MILDAMSLFMFLFPYTFCENGLKKDLNQLKIIKVSSNIHNDDKQKEILYYVTVFLPLNLSSLS